MGLICRVLTLLWLKAFRIWNVFCRLISKKSIDGVYKHLQIISDNKRCLIYNIYISNALVFCDSCEKGETSVKNVKMQIFG